jgi:hypothetical protein
MRVYESFPQLPIGIPALVTRTDGDPRTFGSAILDQVNLLDSRLAVTRISVSTEIGRNRLPESMV